MSEEGILFLPSRLGLSVSPTADLETCPSHADMLYFLSHIEHMMSIKPFQRADRTLVLMLEGRKILVILNGREVTWCPELTILCTKLH